ncbi:agamous-like MADS-box protein AGL80 [Panicum miliaceum]|uniref:Agamous-like MADS-box protein AGL80 n=1 Tax=Panicum miliaceum TaxID=4540 RepID=A0A3L6QWU7_PANMI|nr:agamous-like MADS-box protein AGL80 [Panicum miliaceum]
MARKKVNLQWIINNTTQHATCKRCYKTLMKKTSDLVTLYGGEACVVIYGEGKTQPEVWPSALEAKEILKKFKAMPELGEKTQNQKDFLNSRISMLRDQVCKSDCENQERETLSLILERMDGRRPDLANTTVEELNNLKWIVDGKMMKAKERLQHVAGQGALLEHQTSLKSLMEASYTNIEMQMLAELEELQTLSQDWPPNPSANEGELSAVVHSALGGSSSNYAGPSVELI